MAKSPNNQIRRRVRRVVDVVFEGNVYAAAKATSVQVSTLHRVVEGAVVEPRLGTLSRFAEGAGIPVAWLLGDMSTERAQATAEPLNEEVWLILAHHRTRQARARAKLQQAAERLSEAERIVAELQGFTLDPTRRAFPLPTAARLLEGKSRLTATDIAFVRGCAEFESALLDLLNQEIRQIDKIGNAGPGGGRGGKSRRTEQQV